MKSNNLELIELVVAREGAAVLPPITLRLKRGEALLIHGRNGSGKSSLLKTIAGLLVPESGEVRFRKQPLHQQAAWQTRVVYLGHRRGVEPGLSVRAHTAFWARSFGNLELVDAALHYFDLTDIADVPVHTLSAGWQQRVALTRLIVQTGPIWLLDEPTANLDEDGMRLLNGIIETRQEQGGIIIIASHAKFDADRVQTLDLNALTGAGEVHVLHA